ncbi:seryl-tRNA synthetase [Infundibulicybe gibba]|nr:seryl-tRNA synthetase [Infundibulicybe gibba]
MASLGCQSRRVFQRTHFLRQRYWYSSQAEAANTSRPTASTLPAPRLDYRSICENVIYKATNAINRKAPIEVGTIDSVVREHTEHKRVSETLNAKRNARSMAGERIRKSSLENDSTAKALALEEATALKAEVANLESTLADIDARLLDLALAIPNDTHPNSPLGPESSAVVLSTHGPEPILADTHRDHVSICSALGLLDLESGSKVTGSSWYYLMNEAALLEVALTNYALSVALRHGFTPVTTPDIVRSDIASRCGFQPRDKSNPPVSQMYHIQPHSGSASPELVLSGTSEIPLAGMFANKIYPPGALPLKVVGLGRAFRAEAGARGADTRGLYRVHQFTKIELFAVTAEDASEPMMEEIMQIQKAILHGLGLTFRVLDMPSEELGASAFRKYDMEAWMPGRGKWGEVSSLSNCTDYQARRLHIRYRSQQPKSSTNLQYSPHTPSHPAIPFAHTLNGTAAAVPRLIVALLENGAVFNDKAEVISLRLPAVLKPFWIGPKHGRNLIEWCS